jgi:sec-independent protein translocase protein TatA
MLSSFGYTEMLLLGIIALMLFGSKLPDVARSFGKNYRDLRRKVDDLQREFKDWDKPDYSQSSSKSLLPYNDSDQDRYAPVAPKFIPPSDDEASENT